ncbi:fibroblast growth factor-binding protein 2 [Osmerus eperlanus]|uniref:fibroblast growth factor-binding protein 2 n=1 Tax=Osmerus eperlanus TaxID=29151 RepID=UPI002E0D28F0
MSPPWTLTLLLLCLPALPGSQSKRQSSEPSPTSAAVAKPPRNKSVPGSGELSTKDGHRCTWETSGEGVVSLLIRCSFTPPGEGQEEESYWCRYAGQPDLCPAYGAKSSQYWKQLVGKLKKRRRACDGEKVLKTRTCKKAPAEAHMKLAQRSGEEEGETRKGGGGKKKSSETQAPEVMTERKKEEKKEEMKEEKGEEKKEDMDLAGFPLEREEGEVNDMDPVEDYCAEGWHSVCSFFVRFFEG